MHVQVLLIRSDVRRILGDPLTDARGPSLDPLNRIVGHFNLTVHHHGSRTLGPFRKQFLLPDAHALSLLINGPACFAFAQWPDS